MYEPLRALTSATSPGQFCRSTFSFEQSFFFPDTSAAWFMICAQTETGAVKQGTILGLIYSAQEPAKNKNMVVPEPNVCVPATETDTMRAVPLQPSPDQDFSSDVLPQNNKSVTTIEPPQTENNEEEGSSVVAYEADALNGDNEKQRWNSTATLYCPRNGHQHSNLLTFNLTKCPLCDQNLASVVPRSTSAFSGFRVKGSRSDKKEETHKEKQEITRETNDEPGGATPSPDVPEHLRIGYTVEYQDLGDHHITSVDWGRPFHLEKELELVLSKPSTRKKETVFDVVTVLRTSVPADPLRLSFERERLIKRGFIGNPNISVAVNYTKIVVVSRLFISALKSVVSYDTQDKLESSKLELNEPFALIGHHIEALESYAEQIDDGSGMDAAASGSNQGFAADAATSSGTNSLRRETRIHVGLVLDFVRPFLKDAIAEEVARYSRDAPTCTYRMLWYLFRPGDTVYLKSDEGQDAYMIDSVEMDKFSPSLMDINQTCRINLWYLEFNGVCITRARQETTIKPFKGERLIKSLNVVPCEIWDKIDGGELRTALEDRGKKWVDHLRGKHVEYRDEPVRPGKKPVRRVLFFPQALSTNCTDTLIYLPVTPLC